MCITQSRGCSSYADERVPVLLRACDGDVDVRRRIRVRGLVVGGHVIREEAAVFRPDGVVERERSRAVTRNDDNCEIGVGQPVLLLFESGALDGGEGGCGDAGCGEAGWSVRGSCMLQSAATAEKRVRNARLNMPDCRTTALSPRARWADSKRSTRERAGRGIPYDQSVRSTSCRRP